MGLTLNGIKHAPLGFQVDSSQAAASSRSTERTGPWRRHRPFALKQDAWSPAACTMACAETHCAWSRPARQLVGTNLRLLGPESDTMNWTLYIVLSACLSSSFASTKLYCLVTEATELMSGVNSCQRQVQHCTPMSPCKPSHQTYHGPSLLTSQTWQVVEFYQALASS